MEINLLDLLAAGGDGGIIIVAYCLWRVDRRVLSCEMFMKTYIDNRKKTQ